MATESAERAVTGEVLEVPGASAGLSPQVSEAPEVPPAATRRRQWGTELTRPPLPAVEKPASDAMMWMGGLAIAVTIGAWIAYMILTVFHQVVRAGLGDTGFLVATACYALVMTLLTFSALMYLLARQGAMHRSRSHARVPRAELDAHFANSDAAITVLVPSYCEEPALVRGTLLSAALQEFPHKRIMLLIDDPPNPTDPDRIEGLERCRALPRQIADMLSAPAKRTADGLAACLSRGDGAASGAEVRELVGELEWVANWLLEESIAYPRTSTDAEFVADQVFSALRVDFTQMAAAFAAAAEEGATLPRRNLANAYRRMARTFACELDYFERKQFASLSHEPNKAMNLNSYIGLIGRTFDLVKTPAGVLLKETDGEGDLAIPGTEYVLTLDADSVLLRDYCLRLVYLLEEPGNERIAIAQTPYSAIRGARTRLERMAGATTDIQHIVHSGLTYYNATFWVGANAVIRRAALEDIVEVSYVGGREIRRYVQDRTVIEDTESSIDLVREGWSLYNYPERLSYSATPPDFGALVVQRGRWANGGLLVIPNFMRYVRQQRRAGTPVPMAEICLRLNYMGSICWASFSLVFLLAVPFSGDLLSPVIFLAALPYFLAMSSDFHRLGYKHTDIFRSYGFNLILLPVNLAGVLKSMQQAASKSKTAFARTPKVANRTAAPATYILAILLIIAFSAYTLERDIIERNVTNGIFAGANVILTSYALLAFVGLRVAIADVFLGMTHWIRVPAKQPKAAAQPDLTPDWRSILYFGPGESPHSMERMVAPVGDPHGELPTVAAANELAPQGTDDMAWSTPAVETAIDPDRR